MEAHFEPDVESANVIGEITGRERPEEIVLVGCHFDSWDAATGASDDAVGCIVTWEVAAADEEAEASSRAAPCVSCCSPTRRTACAAATPTATRYAKDAANHVLAIESDSGVFAPARLAFSGSESARRIITEIGTLLAGIDMQQRRARRRRRGHRPHRPGRAACR